VRSARVLLLALAVCLGAAAPASAADPIMPLSEVAKGMRCTAYSVLQGVEIESFGAEVVDVIAGDPAADAPRILVRFSGANIERTGVGPGFSGSPIYCDGRVIGAISEAIGEYGGLVALATPIESMLGEPVDPPPGARSSRRVRNARSLAGPLTLGGVSPRVGAFFTRVARRAGRTLLATPGTPRQTAFPFQVLRPGASMAAGLAGGDLTAGSVGTVTYVDGDKVWGFGHPLDGAGRRSLFLQDAYVYTVVNNPVGVEGAGTYKLAVPGHDVGLLSGDGQSAVAGRLGVLPARFTMTVNARDLDTGRKRVLDVNVADESGAGFPVGGSALGLAGAGAVSQAASTILRSSPARQTGELCARIQVRERRRPFRFCNRYVTRTAAEESVLEGAGLGAAGAMAADFAEAAVAIDEFNFADLHVTDVDVNIKLRRGLRQAFLLDVQGPATVRRGRTARLRVKSQEVRGPARWRTVRVRVPSSTPTGERELTLSGTPADSAAGLEVDLGELLFDENGDAIPAEELDEAGPRTLESLARSIARISRFDGVVASFLEPGDEDGPGGAARRVLRDPELRLSGSVRLPVVVR
jgi:hypothetical protein